MVEIVSLEIVLNLVWLAVSLALLIIGGSHVVRGGEERSRGLAAVAMVCLVCFLFPVISMTDDLNCSGPAMLEPSKLKKLVPSAAVIFALFPWPVLQTPPQSNWNALTRATDARLPLPEVFSFSLRRRPPPLPPGLS